MALRKRSSFPGSALGLRLTISFKRTIGSRCFGLVWILRRGIVRPREQPPAPLVEPHFRRWHSFRWKVHPIASNLAGELYLTHGNGFSGGWTVELSASAGAELSLTSHGPGPFRYAARASYGLQAGALTKRLTIANLGAEPLPFGLGFHPWIVREADTRLKAKAEWVVLETADHLPSSMAPVSSHPQWDFSERRSLPSRWINNAFLTWDGPSDDCLGRPRARPRDRGRTSP